MGEDEVGTARAVREHREAPAPMVAAHGGRIVKTMGDGVYWNFHRSWPVECLRALQADARSSALRNACPVPLRRRSWGAVVRC